MELEQSAHLMFYSEAKTILRNKFRTEWRQRLDIGTEEDSIHQLDRAAQVTICRLRTGHMRHRSSTPQPHPAVLPHLGRFETPDMAQSSGCPQKALGTGWDTAADWGLRLSHRTDDLAWQGMQKNSVAALPGAWCSKVRGRMPLIFLLLLLLLLLCSQLCRWGSPFWERFLRM